MKTSCKNIDITNPSVIKPWVMDCLLRHYRRNDFRRMLKPYEGKHSLDIIAKIISLKAAKQIRDRSLEYDPPTIRQRVDSTTQKLRLIGCESPMNQIFDYIAVYAAMPIFERRMVYEQCSSIPKRGQVYGKNLIHKYAMQDITAERYAEETGTPFVQNMKYFVKLDIKKCYPSANTDKFLELFSKDCGNPDIVWLWSEILRRQKVNEYTGFMIGAVTSQWAAQYMISFIYRFARTQGRARRNSFVSAVSHMVIFMDDMLLTARNRTQLKKAVDRTIAYTKEHLGWTINPEYHIRQFDKFPIDMMGYVIHRDGHITVRARNFVKARRMLIRYQERGYLDINQSRRLISYNGQFKHSDSFNARRKYKLGKAVRCAKKNVSNYDKRKAVILDGNRQDSFQRRADQPM